ncbi:MAG: hypothetical protein K2K55_03680, partial [Duncaniella sp.]|nr:hypothetical protein [Duncaniella sp.]
MLAQVEKSHYLCNVFFMVLDLRLTKIGCRETTFFFCTTRITKDHYRTFSFAGRLNFAEKKLRCYEQEEYK